MTSMVERMARAIREADIEATCRRYPATPRVLIELSADALASDHRDFALASLRAMREPTEGMLEEACVEADRHGYYHTRGYFDTDVADYAWRAMIDAAIQEAETA